MALGEIERDTMIEEEADRVRQSERTVDNLKRLYAVLFAVSFSLLATGIVAKINSVLKGEVWTAKEIVLHMEVTFVYALTAGLFYYQSDRVLDTTLARKPLPDVSAGSFAMGYLVNVLTMAPFYFMAFALGEPSRSKAGFTLYFLAYLALITNGLFWLFLNTAIKAAMRVNVSRHEVEGLNRFWMIMNSVMLFVVAAMFQHFASKSTVCVAGKIDGVGFAFVALLGLTVLARDAIDYFHGWPILYPVREQNKQIQRRPALAWLIRSQGLRITAFWFSLAVTALSLLILARTGVFDLAAVARVCGP